MEKNRRTAVIGALTLAALIISFILAIRARAPAQVQLVIVAPAGSEVRVEGARSRTLPEQPHTSEGLTSFYFTITPGHHEVRFRERGKAERIQAIEVAAQNRPAIYTLLRDTLRAMQEAQP
jgi:hypothetical protein